MNTRKLADFETSPGGKPKSGQECRRASYLSATEATTADLILAAGERVHVGTSLGLLLLGDLHRQDLFAWVWARAHADPHRVLLRHRCSLCIFLGTLGGSRWQRAWVLGLLGCGLVTSSRARLSRGFFRALGLESRKGDS